MEDLNIQNQEELLEMGNQDEFVEVEHEVAPAEASASNTAEINIPSDVPDVAAQDVAMPDVAVPDVAVQDVATQDVAAQDVESIEPNNQEMSIVARYKDAKRQISDAQLALNKATSDKRKAVSEAKKNLEMRQQEKNKRLAHVGYLSLYVDRLNFRGKDYALTPDIRFYSKITGEVRYVPEYRSKQYLDFDPAGGLLGGIYAGETGVLLGGMRRYTVTKTKNKKVDERKILLVVQTSDGRFTVSFKYSYARKLNEFIKETYQAAKDAEERVAAADKAISDAQEELDRVESEGNARIASASALLEEHTSALATLKNSMTGEEQQELKHYQRVSTLRAVLVVAAVAAVIYLLLF